MINLDNQKAEIFENINIYKLIRIYLKERKLCIIFYYKRNEI